MIAISYAAQGIKQLRSGIGRHASWKREGMNSSALKLHEQITDHLQRGDWEAARFRLRRLLMHFAPTDECRADALTVTAYACLRAGYIDEAVSFAKAALAITSDHELALETLNEAIATTSSEEAAQ